MEYCSFPLSGEQDWGVAAELTIWPTDDLGGGWFRYYHWLTKEHGASDSQRVYAPSKKFLVPLGLWWPEGLRKHSHRCMNQVGPRRPVVWYLICRRWRKSKCLTACRENKDSSRFALPDARNKSSIIIRRVTALSHSCLRCWRTFGHAILDAETEEENW